MCGLPSSVDTYLRLAIPAGWTNALCIVRANIGAGQQPGSLILEGALRSIPYTMYSASATVQNFF